MKNIFSLILLLFGLNSIAQKTYTLKRDTINLRGYIYNSNGSPAANIPISSKARDLINNSDILQTITNSSGHFEIKGARFNDTLTVNDKNVTAPLYFYNRGSRYVVIYLSAITIINLNKKDSIVISARRKNPKVTPSFKITTLDYVKLTDGMERLPEYIGGNDRFLAYIKQHLTYPEQAVQHNIEGEVKIQFTVERDGTLINFKTLQGIGYGCDEALINVIKTSPKWKPGILGSRPVAVDHTIAVQFRLNN